MSTTPCVIVCGGYIERIEGLRGEGERTGVPRIGKKTDTKQKRVWSDLRQRYERDRPRRRSETERD
jgi:predicted Fe-S protein YdhL (DUF1289 family)